VRGEPKTPFAYCPPPSRRADRAFTRGADNDWATLAWIIGWLAVVILVARLAVALMGLG
jgi:hypothetical protein